MSEPCGGSAERDKEGRGDVLRFLVGSGDDERDAAGMKSEMFREEDLEECYDESVGDWRPLRCVTPNITIVSLDVVKERCKITSYTYH